LAKAIGKSKFYLVALTYSIRLIVGMMEMPIECVENCSKQNLLK
jgi:hypothetical protein